MRCAVPGFCNGAVALGARASNGGFKSEVASRSRKKVPARQRYLGPFVRKYSSTNRRIAEDRLPCWRVASIFATNADSVACY